MHQRGFIRPTYTKCKYCKKIVYSNVDFRCKGPCKQLVHYKCIIKVYEDYMTENIKHGNFYCLSCSVDELNQNFSQINVSSKSTSSPKINTSISPKKIPLDVKNQIDTPGSSGNSNMKSPKDNISTFFTSPTKKSPNVKNQIDTSGPSGNSNMKSPKDNISTFFTSPTKKSPNVKNQIESLSPYKTSNLTPSKCNIYTDCSSRISPSVIKNLQFETHDTEEHINFEKSITQIEKDEKLIRYLQQYSAIQVKMLAQIGNDVNSLKSQQTKMEEEMQDTKNIQLHILNEIKAQYQKINNYFVYQASRISGDEKVEFV